MDVVCSEAGECSGKNRAIGHYFLVADKDRHDVEDLSPIMVEVVDVADGASRPRLIVLDNWSFKMSVRSQHKSGGNNFIENPANWVWVWSIWVLLCWVGVHKLVGRVSSKIESRSLVDVDSVDAVLRTAVGVLVRRCIVIERGQMVGMN